MFPRISLMSTPSEGHETRVSLWRDDIGSGNGVRQRSPTDRVKILGIKGLPSTQRSS